MKKILITLSIILTGFYLASAISLNLLSGDKLNISSWQNINNITNKLNLDNNNLNISGNLISSGKICAGNVCLGDKTGTIDNPGTSCKTILDDGDSSGDGLYYIDPNGGDNSDKFEVYCDMTTDGGGWTLAFNVVTDIIQPDLYNTELGSPSLSSNYMVGMDKLGLDSSSIMKFTCKKSNGTRINFFQRNITDFSSYFIVSGSYAGSIECARDSSFTSEQGSSLSECLVYNDSGRRYYGLNGQYLWAHYETTTSSPHLLRHCDQERYGEGTAGLYGRIWIR